MKIIITESQYKTLIESHTEKNSKPAAHFDALYGTELSWTYDFGDGLTSDDVWHMWVKCRDHGKCDSIDKLVERLPIIFPYYNVNKLDERQKFEIILGMASEFNPADIVNFAVHKVYADRNIEQHRLVKQLPPEVAYNLQWVLSSHSMDIIRNKFGINEV